MKSIMPSTLPGLLEEKQTHNITELQNILQWNKTLFIIAILLSVFVAKKLYVGLVKVVVACCKLQVLTFVVKIFVAYLSKQSVGMEMPSVGGFEDLVIPMDFT